MDRLAHAIMLISAAAAGSLIHAIGVGVLLAGAVAICLRFLPGIKPATRFLLWLAVMFAVLPLHLLPPAESSLGSSLPSGASFHLDPRWSLLIVGAWGVLSLLRAFRLLQSALELRRIAATAILIEPDPACRALLSNGHRSAKLCISPDVDRPSVVGFFHPRVLLPSELIQRFSTQELEQIILHEMEHLRRRDDWTNLLQKIALILFPLNPVLVWVERRLCIERELACDDCVLNFTSARKAYATCLTNLAEHSLLRRSVSLALGAWERRSELSRRVHRILHKPERTMGRTATNVATGALMAGLLGGAVTLAHSPELISFAPPIARAASSPIPSIQQPVAATAISEPIAHNQNFAPTLVKAVMPEPQQKSVAPRQTTRPHPETIKTIHRPSRPRPQHWVVLTGWQVNSSAPRPVLAVSETSSYAAVRVGNGWLILQL